MAATTRSRKSVTATEAPVAEVTEQVQEVTSAPQTEQAEASVESTETTENTAQPTVVDLTQLTGKERDEAIKLLLERKKAEKKAAAEAKKAEREAQASTKQDTSAQDAEMLTDIAKKLSALDLTVTNSEPRGFRRYTGSVMVTFTEKDDQGNDVQVERLCNLTCTMRVANR